MRRPAETMFIIALYAYVYEVCHVKAIVKL